MRQRTGRIATSPRPPRLGGIKKLTEDRPEIGTADPTPARAKESVQQELRALAEIFEALGQMLREMADSLPDLPQAETFLVLPREMVLSVAGSFRGDGLLSAVREILKLAEVQPGAAGGGEEP